MNTRLPAPRQRLLWRHLWYWTLATLALVWAGHIAVAYVIGWHEAEEITDGQLVSVARLGLQQTAFPGATVRASVPPAWTPSPHDLTYSPQLWMVAWEDERVQWDPDGMAPSLPASLALGHQTIALQTAGGEHRYRAYVAQSDATAGPQRRVVVLMEYAKQDRMGRDIAGYMIHPALIVIPLAAAMLAWSNRRGIRPLERLARQIDALDTHAGQTLPPEHRYTEIASITDAINGLVERLQMQVQRERRFTSDVAHELRTPLTSAIWQARLAIDSTDPAQRSAALRQVEGDTLRAGRILTQLLDLARAQGLDATSTEDIDLGELASRLLSHHGQIAHDTRHELALNAPATPVRVHGNTMMLELALRNLLDNALRHTPPGTQVQVDLAQDGEGVHLAVSDDGAHLAGGTPEAHPAGTPTAGLGIGLTLVQRIAHWHGATLTRDQGAAPFTTRFALHWPQPAAPAGSDTPPPSA